MDQLIANHRRELAALCEKYQVRQIIAEAMSRLRKLSPETTERISEYRGIISFRNVLSHGYDLVNTDTTWAIIENKVPCSAASLRNS